MATVAELNVAIGAEIGDLDRKMRQAEQSIRGVGSAAEDANQQAGSAFSQMGSNAEAASGRYVDATGRMREANGRFVSAATLAAEAAGGIAPNVGKASGAIGGLAGAINGQLIGAFDAFDKKKDVLDKGIGRLGEGLKDVGGNLTAFVTVPLGLLAGAALKSASDIQALEKGFRATLKPGEDFATNLAKVQKLAQLPGLGLQEALQGATNLQAAGFSADLAQRSLVAFGNALATVGKGKADLDGVGLALGQIASKGKISAEEINQLAERVPQIRAAMKAAFGTADTEQLQKAKISATDFVEGVTRELEKLPKVTGGLKNAFENLSDLGVIALAKLGDALNKNFDVEGVLNGLGSTIQGLVSRFESLDPSTQKLIFLLAGVVAAAGPVLVVVGSIGAAIPALAAGFAALTGPIGLAVVALAALVAAGVAYAASAEDAVGAFRRQKSAVDDLEKGVSPLLKRYDELKAQTKLTKSEQEELRSIVQKVGEQIPTSITQFDAYGKAMDISSEAARRFVQQQREILAIKNKGALKEQREEYARLTAEINETTRALNKRNAAGQLVRTDVGFGQAGAIDVELTGKEIGQLQSKLDGLRSARRGVGGLIDELKGIAPVLKEAKAAGPVTPVINAEAAKKAEDMRKALEKLQASLRVNGQLSNLLGKDYDFIGERQKILEGGVRSLIEAGYDPASKAVRKYADELRLLTAIQAGATKPLQISAPTTVTPQVQGGTAAGLDAGLTQLKDYQTLLQSLDRQTAFLPLPQFAADGVKQIQADAAAYVAALKSLTPAQIAALDAQTLFNTEMKALLSDIGPQFSSAIGSIAASFGEAAGAIVAGGASFGDGLGIVFSGILTALAGFIGQFGQQLIAIGIGKLALDNLFKGPAGGPAAIAAGIGLVALAGVAKAVAAGSSRSLGNITGASSGGSGLTPSAPAVQRTEAQKLQINVTFAPVLLRQDGSSLRGVLNVDEYNIKRFS